MKKDFERITVCIAFAHGCPRSEAEVSLLSAYFLANGFELSDKIVDADLVLVATCGFDACAEHTSFKLIHSALEKTRQGSQVVVIGCLPGINRERLIETFGNRVVLMPPYSMDGLDDIANCGVSFSSFTKDHVDSKCFVTTDIQKRQHNRTDPTGRHVSLSTNPAHRDAFGVFDRLKAGFPLSEVTFDKFLSRVCRLPQIPYARQKQVYIPGLLLARGCLGECSYCAIRFAAGPLKSIPIDSILRQFSAFLDGGHKEISMIAADVGAYGQDIGTNIVELLNALFSTNQAFRLIIRDFSPRWLVKYASELINLFSNNIDKIDHIILPIQSGSERIVSLMKRGYKVADVKDILCTINRTVPALSIGTHVLIGFPGETSKDFRDTVDFLQVYRFRHIKVFNYSDRPHTASSRFPGKVPGMIKRLRLLVLLWKFFGVAE